MRETPLSVTHKGGFNLGIFAFSLGTSSSKTPANAGLISSVINSTVTAIIVRSFDAKKKDWFIILYSAVDMALFVGVPGGYL